jgi:hypothetical protein
MFNNEQKLEETLRSYFINQSLINLILDCFADLDRLEEIDNVLNVLNTFIRANFHETIYICSPNAAAAALRQLAPEDLENVYLFLRKDVLRSNLKILFDNSVLPYTLTMFRDMLVLRYRNHNGPPYNIYNEIDDYLRLRLRDVSEITVQY